MELMVSKVQGQNVVSFVPMHIIGLSSRGSIGMLYIVQHHRSNRHDNSAKHYHDGADLRNNYFSNMQNCRLVAESE